MLYVSNAKKMSLLLCLLCLPLKSSEKRRISFNKIESSSALRRKVEQFAGSLPLQTKPQILSTSSLHSQKESDLSDTTNKLPVMPPTANVKRKKRIKPKQQPKKTESEKQEEKPACQLSSRLEVLRKNKEEAEKNPSLPDNFYVSRHSSSFVKPGIITYTFGKNLRPFEKFCNFEYRIFVRIHVLSINREYTQDLQESSSECGHEIMPVIIPKTFWAVFPKSLYQSASSVQKKLEGQMRIIKEYKDRFLGVGISSVSYKNTVPAIRIANDSSLITIKPEICTIYGNHGSQGILSDGNFVPFCEDLNE